ncbi:MAG: hypothetical protein M3370_01100, partial [Actinomycetota bacterium]|nr:hypothetical protein [Actinomycetota bacterium]
MKVHLAHTGPGLRLLDGERPHGQVHAPPPQVDQLTNAQACARTEGDGLGVFIRSLVGLDRDAATDAVADFAKGRAMTASQLDFVALVVEHLTVN